MKKIHALGPAGSFGHEAARIFLKQLGLSEDDIIFQSTNTSLLPAAERDTAFAVVPVENSAMGDVAEVLNYLAKKDENYPLRIIGQVELSVRHCLLVTKDIKSVSELNGVTSHPQAIGQCREALNRLGIQTTIPATSTSEAARTVAEHPEKKLGAIASAFAGELYDLTVLERGIQTQSDNTTRFFLFGPARETNPTGNDKTVLTFRVRNESGTLWEALASFQSHRINMTSIHSAPLGGWSYAFYAEIDGHEKDIRVQSALAELESKTTKHLILGSFPK